MRQQPPILNRPTPRGWRKRWMRRYGMDTAMSLRKDELTIPNWLVGKSVVFFFIAMLACWLAWGYIPPSDLIAVSAISVLIFFYGGLAMSKGWSRTKEKAFVKNVFITGLSVRLLWLLYVCFFKNIEHYGYAYGDNADTGWYMPFAKDIAQWIVGDSAYSLSQIIDNNCSAIDDTGYPMWLAIAYVIWGEWSDANVVIGKFRTKKSLRIVDLTNLPKLSFWMENYDANHFLYLFHAELVKSLAPDDTNAISYVPSQVFTEYLRYMYKDEKGNHIDGMVYKSAKTNGHNIVLFYDQQTSRDILELVGYEVGE